MGFYIYKIEILFKEKYEVATKSHLEALQYTQNILKKSVMVTQKHGIIIIRGSPKVNDYKYK